MASPASAHFAFGSNWLAFSSQIDDARIAIAEHALKDLLARERLDDLRFLDIGSGSGLSSLAARRLGATVHSFDYDQQSVQCTAAVRERYQPGDPRWVVEQGSILDRDYLARLGRFDVVYAWGVLHHTGDLQAAIRNAGALVAPGGQLAIAIYRRTLLCWAWRVEKRWYTQATPEHQARARRIYTALYRGALRATGRDPAQRIKDYASTDRGMDFERDAHDWLGGYPYESLRPAEVHEAVRAIGLAAERQNVRGGSLLWGCDEFVFRATGAGTTAK